MAEYRYASGDLMGSRQTYFYTSFEGTEFLKAWRRARQAMLDQLPPPVDQAPPVLDGAVGTAALLERAVDEADTGASSGGQFGFHAETMLRKFEVGKRVYDEYDENLKPVDREHFRTHAYYVRAAEAFELMYANVGDIRALNVLLKSLDTLCAHASELDAELGSRLARLLLREREYVESLRVALDVELP